jgi:hypothetical protein
MAPDPPAAVMVTWADALRFCGEAVADAGDEPAGAASTYAACTVNVPCALAISAPLPIVANVPFDTLHCVPVVTSWVVPSLRCATAFRTAAPPTGTDEGLAVTVREARVWDEGLPHPANTMHNPLRSPEHTCSAGEIRIDCLVSWKFEAARPGEKGLFKGANGLSHPRDTSCRQRRFLVLLVLLSRAERRTAITPMRYYVS